jgi:anaerobic selenocysteine-containing dehydrogenase
MSPEDAKRLGLAEGDLVRIASRRGTVMAPMHVDSGLRPGLVFLTLHFPDQVATNELTVDAVDPRSGTSEFKAAAVRVERVGVPELAKMERDAALVGVAAPSAVETPVPVHA